MDLWGDILNWFKSWKSAGGWTYSSSIVEVLEMKHNCHVAIQQFWTMYPSLQNYIIFTYDGSYGTIQNLATAISNQSKDTFLLDIFLNKFPMIWVNILFFNFIFSCGMLI